MIPILYNATETAFDNNGIGPLTDAVICNVSEERNGPYELVLQYPMTGDHFSDIQKRCQIRAKPANNRTEQTFRIYDIGRPMNGIVTVSARHISYDAAGIVADPFEASSARQAMQKLQTETVPQNTFEMWTDSNATAQMVNKVPSSVRSLLGGRQGSLLDLYGGEYEFDNRRIMLHTARGQNKGVSIRYGKNLLDIRQEENCAKVRTGVYPYWAGQVQNEGEEEPHDVLVRLPEKTVKAPGTYDFESIMPLDLSFEWQEPPTVDQLRERTQKYVEDNQIGIPRVTLKVSFAQLEQSEEYRSMKLLEEVNLCDTVTVIFPALGVDTTAKCCRTVYNVLLDRMESVELGDSRASIADTIVNTGNQIEQAIGGLENKIPTPNTIKSIAMEITAQILGARGGAVRLLDNDKDGVPDTLYIADNPDPSKAVKVWRWNFEGWGASKNGYNGPFTMAATLEQGLYADFITAGTLTANLIKAGVLADEGGNFSLDLGTGVCDIKKGNISLGPKDELQLSDDGSIIAQKGKIAGFDIDGEFINSRNMLLGQGEIIFSDHINVNESAAAINFFGSGNAKGDLEIAVRPGNCIKFSTRRDFLDNSHPALEIYPDGKSPHGGKIEVNAETFIHGEIHPSANETGQSIGIEISPGYWLDFTNGILVGYGSL